MRTLALASLLALAACHVPWGVTPESYPPARRAAGTTAYVTMTTGRVEGELLEVRDTALVLRTRDRIVLVLTSQAQQLDFEDLRRHKRVHDSLTSRDRERLRLLSRYPQGIPPGVMQQILADRRQTEPIVIDR